MELHQKIDYNPDNALGRTERNLMMQLSGPKPRLDYPTEGLKMANGCIVERYIIPESDKQQILEELYPFTDCPSLDDELVDIHTNKTFKVRDYIVTREGNGNFLVTPYYAEAGGTVLDWLKPGQASVSDSQMTVALCRLRPAIQEKAIP